jgi:CheY-like chemotaxis protein
VPEPGRIAAATEDLPMSKILIIDDDPDVRQVMRRVLERRGHSVQEAEDGAIGIALVEAERPDVVVTDLIMPEKEGIETILDLQERFPEVRIVAVSGAEGGAEGGPLLDARLLGAAATLSKPFSVDALVRIVEGVLESD